jgi:hypothetical protein
MKACVSRLLVMCCTSILLIVGCATTTEKIETKYTVKDHFMAGPYEVGALEYESGKRGSFTLLWGFPVYLNGQKVKTYYCQTQSTSEYEKQKEAQSKLSRGANAPKIQTVMVHANELVLIEETLDANFNIIKEYKNTTPVYYETVKEDIIRILKDE